MLYTSCKLQAHFARDAIFVLYPHYLSLLLFPRAKFRDDSFVPRIYIVVEQNLKRRRACIIYIKVHQRVVIPSRERLLCARFGIIWDDNYMRGFNVSFEVLISTAGCE